MHLKIFIFTSDELKDYVTSTNVRLLKILFISVHRNLGWTSFYLKYCTNALWHGGYQPVELSRCNGSPGCCESCFQVIFFVVVGCFSFSSPQQLIHFPLCAGQVSFLANQVQRCPGIWTGFLVPLVLRTSFTFWQKRNWAFSYNLSAEGRIKCSRLLTPDPMTIVLENPLHWISKCVDSVGLHYLLENLMSKWNAKINCIQSFFFSPSCNFYRSISFPLLSNQQYSPWLPDWPRLRDHFSAQEIFAGVELIWLIMEENY